MFEFSTSAGASRGLIVIWNSNLFSGSLILSNAYYITIIFVCYLFGNSFHLSNIYGPSKSVDKAAFILWLYHLDITSYEDWILAGDFNLIRTLENRNKLGGNVCDMMTFNDPIQHLDLVDIAFHGRNYTLSNMQLDLLLEKLDWIFRIFTSGS